MNAFLRGARSVRAHTLTFAASKQRIERYELKLRVGVLIVFGVGAVVSMAARLMDIGWALRVGNALLLASLAAFFMAVTTWKPPKPAPQNPADR